MSEQRLREIAEREKAATPGEWRSAWNDPLELQDEAGQDSYKTVYVVDAAIENGVGDGVVELFYYDGWWAGATKENAEFIAHARQDIPWLLANTTNALAYIDRILAHNPNGAQLMFLTEVKRILTGESDGRPTSEASDAK